MAGRDLCEEARDVWSRLPSPLRWQSTTKAAVRCSVWRLVRPSFWTEFLRSLARGVKLVV